jgi:hypothetical protein
VELDPEIIHLFGSQLDSQKYGSNYNQLLDEYSKAVYSKFGSSVPTTEQQHMLR